VEYRYYGYRTLYDGFTGYSKIEIDDPSTGSGQADIARVYLTGACGPREFGFGLPDLIFLNLKQFPEIHYVKLYDADGLTADPDGISDSLPECLTGTPTPGP